MLCVVYIINMVMQSLCKCFTVTRDCHHDPIYLFKVGCPVIDAEIGLKVIKLSIYVRDLNIYSKNFHIECREHCKLCSINIEALHQFLDHPIFVF